MRVLIIDNYDSFVHNLGRYFKCLGAEIMIYRNDKILISEIEGLAPDCIVLSPGPCTPNEAGICLELVQRFRGQIPLLGVCLGHQVIGQVYGGSVVRANRPLHGQASVVHHKDSVLLGHLPPEITVGRYHSLVVEANTVSSRLAVTAWSQEGDVMALEDTSMEVYGLQFHPESILTDNGQSMIAAFLGRCVGHKN